MKAQWQVTLYSVIPAIAVRHIFFGPLKNPGDDCKRELLSKLALSDWSVGQLSMDEVTTVRFDDLIATIYPGPNPQLGGSDIAISVEFSPLFLKQFV
jgi:hypothetical protein